MNWLNVHMWPETQSVCENIQHNLLFSLNSSSEGKPVKNIFLICFGTSKYPCQGKNELTLLKSLVLLNLHIGVWSLEALVGKLHTE